MKTGIIYKVTNLINDKVYIGQTIQKVSQRKREHYKFSKKNYNYKFSNALRKYEKENFDWSIIEKDVCVKNLNKREIYYINFFNSFNLGYNSTPGGTVRFGRKAYIKVNPIDILNVVTGEVLNTTAYDFCKEFNLKGKEANVYRFFNGKFLRYKDWIFKEKLEDYHLFLQKRKETSKNVHLDKNEYIFKNKDEIFKGTRNEFINKFNLNKSGVSDLINGKRGIHKGWKKEDE